LPQRDFADFPAASSVLFPCWAQFRTEGYGEVAEPNRFTLFLELL
jgi:hypothetical protein